LTCHLNHHVDLSGRFLETLFCCLANSSVSGIGAELFDYRYFYPDDNEIGNCTCGLAREGAALVLREKKPDKFLSHEWLKSIMWFTGNPGALGSMVEQSCLSALSSHGLNYGAIHWSSASCTTKIFRGDLIQSLPTLTQDFSTLFIPHNPHFKNIDACYLRVTNKPTRKVHVVPIQITIADLEAHKHSEQLFYLDWPRWQMHFVGYIMSTTFVWIVEDGRSWEMVDTNFRETRSGLHMTMPQHERAVIPLKEINSHLGDALARNRYLTAKTSSRLVHPPTSSGRAGHISESVRGEPGALNAEASSSETARTLDSSRARQRRKGGQRKVAKDAKGRGKGRGKVE
jgi:hypothetical protein